MDPKPAHEGLGQGGNRVRRHLDCRNTRNREMYTYKRRRAGGDDAACLSNTLAVVIPGIASFQIENGLKFVPMKRSERWKRVNYTAEELLYTPMTTGDESYTYKMKSLLLEEENFDTVGFHQHLGCQARNDHYRDP